MEEYSFGISVVVPVYNVEQWLSDCLDSLLTQTRPFEKIVVVDDGSTDNSAKLCDIYESKSSNISVIHQKNGGLGQARNVGLSQVESEYVMFVDSDDILVDSAVEILMQVLEQTPYDSLYFDFQNFYDKDFDNLNTNINSKRMAGTISKTTGIEMFSLMYPNNYVVSACGNVYKSALIKKILFPEKILFEDNYTFFVNMVNAKYVGYISDRLYQRRLRTESIMTSCMSYKKICDHCEVSRLIYEYLIGNKKIMNQMDRTKLIQFILMYIDILISYIEQIEETDSITVDADLEVKMQQTWELCIIAIQKIGIKTIDFPSMIRVEKTIQKMEKRGFSQKCFISERLFIYKKIRAGYYNKFNMISLNDSAKTYCIYGIGKHTCGLLDAYEFLKGAIVARLLFYVTNNNGDLFFQGQEVNNIEDLAMDNDGIIISSFQYEDEMKRKIDELYPNANIISFYEDCDVDLFSDSDIDFFRKITV